MTVEQFAHQRKTFIGGKKPSQVKGESAKRRQERRAVGGAPR